jgi:hypothetical protein
MCAACQVGKQARESSGFSRSNQPASRQDLTPQIIPGECVSIDQYIPAIPGSLKKTKGKENKGTKTMVALFSFITQPHTSITATKSPFELAKHLKQNIPSKNLQVTMVYE